METGSEMIVEMLRRSYFAADGLWFVMLEEDEGLERAMELDERVWSIMPKIQARKARELLDIDGHSPADLAHCMALKFAAEGHAYDVHAINPDRAEIVIRRCPWREVLESSDRAHLGPQIAEQICAREAAGWAEEFSAEGGATIAAEMPEAICLGDDCCRFLFQSTDDTPIE